MATGAIFLSTWCLLMALGNCWDKRLSNQSSIITYFDNKSHQARYTYQKTLALIKIEII